MVRRLIPQNSKNHTGKVFGAISLLIVIVCFWYATTLSNATVVNEVRWIGLGMLLSAIYFMFMA